MAYVVTDLPEPYVPSGVEVLGREASVNGIVLVLDCPPGPGEETAQLATRAGYGLARFVSLAEATAFAAARGRDSGDWPDGDGA
jgi:hypothetical protein